MIIRTHKHGKSEGYKDRDIAILAVGGMVRTAEDVARKLRNKVKSDIS